jgi:hypothetical protein
VQLVAEAAAAVAAGAVDVLSGMTTLHRSKPGRMTSLMRLTHPLLVPRQARGALAATRLQRKAAIAEHTSLPPSRLSPQQQPPYTTSAQPPRRARQHRPLPRAALPLPPGAAAGPGAVGGAAAPSAAVVEVTRTAWRRPRPRARQAPLPRLTRRLSSSLAPPWPTRQATVLEAGVGAAVARLVAVVGKVAAAVAPRLPHARRVAHRRRRG